MGGVETGLSDTMWGVISAVAIFLILAVVIFLRTRKINVTLPDVIVAIVPVVLVLAAAGKIESLKVSPEGLAFEMTKKAFLTATAGTVGGDISQTGKVEYDTFQTDEKGGYEQLQKLVQLGDLGALNLRLGSNYYVAEAVRVYLETLTQNPKFRYLALVTHEGQLFGAIDARRLSAWLDGGGIIAPENNRAEWLAEMRRQLNATEGLKGIPTAMVTTSSMATEALTPWNLFIDAVKKANTGLLENIPGFVPGAQAITRETTKRVALQRMSDLGADWLPVVDPKGQLTGSVDRTQLTASVVLDIAANFEKLSAPGGK